MTAAVHHPIFARLYARMSPRVDAKGGVEHRRETLAGLNFAHYPDTVTDVVAVEPEGYLRARAEETAAGGPVTAPHIIGLGRKPAGHAAER